MRSTLLACAPALLVLSGCSMNPRLEKPVPPVAQAFPGPPHTRASPLPISTGAPSSVTRLQRLIDLALTDSRDLRIAVLQAQEARAQFRVARGARLPAVEAQGNYTRQRAPSSVAGAGVGIGDTPICLPVSNLVSFQRRLR
jgi:outer membrane protein TolC